MNGQTNQYTSISSRMVMDNGIKFGNFVVPFFTSPFYIAWQRTNLISEAKLRNALAQNCVACNSRFIKTTQHSVKISMDWFKWIAIRLLIVHRYGAKLLCFGWTSKNRHLVNMQRCSEPQNHPNVRILLWSCTAIDMKFANGGYYVVTTY